MKSLLKLAVALSLLGLILWRLGGISPILTAFSRLRPEYLVALILVALADRALMAGKWLLLLRSLGVQLSFSRTLTLYCVSSFWGQLLPMTVGGDLVRFWLTKRETGHAEAIAASIAIERLIGFLAALITGLASLIVLGRIVALGPEFQRLWWLALGVLAAGIATLLLTMSRSVFDQVHRRMPASWSRTRVMGRLREVHEVCIRYRRHGATLGLFFVLTLLEQLAPIVFLWVAARALRVDLGVAAAFAIAPIATLVTRVPLSLGGIGVLEGSFMILLPLVGVAPGVAVSIALIDRAVQILATTPWWLRFVLARRSLRLPEGAIERPTGSMPGQ